MQRSISNDPRRRGAWRRVTAHPTVRRVILPWLAVYFFILIAAVGGGAIAGDHIALAIGGPRHVGELLGVVFGLYVVRWLWVLLARRHWRTIRQRFEGTTISYRPRY